MQTYRVLLIGEADNIVYSVKEFEAADAGRAEQIAQELGGLGWGDQRLQPKLVSARRSERCG
jgi:hypothetical protein